MPPPHTHRTTQCGQHPFHTHTHTLTGQPNVVSSLLETSQVTISCIKLTIKDSISLYRPPQVLFQLVLKISPCSIDSNHIFMSLGDKEGQGKHKISFLNTRSYSHPGCDPFITSRLFWLITIYPLVLKLISQLTTATCTPPHESFSGDPGQYRLSQFGPYPAFQLLPKSNCFCLNYLHDTWRK